VESSLQGISSSSLLRKRNKLSVKIWTCSWRGKPAANDERLRFIYPCILCYKFLTSKCRRELDLGLYMTSGLAKRMPLRSADLPFFNLFGGQTRRKSALRSGIIFVSPEVMHRPRSGQDRACRISDFCFKFPLIQSILPPAFPSSWKSCLSKVYIYIYTANPTWGDIFESSKLKAWTSLLPRFSEKRRSSFELWALKRYSKISPQVGSAVPSTDCLRCLNKFLKGTFVSILGGP